MRNIINKAITIVGTVVSIIVIVMGLISVGKVAYGMIKGEEEPGYVEPSEKNHEIVVTTYDVKRELHSMAELMTYAYDYSGTAAITDYRETPIFGINIPLTKHQVKMTYAGTIKIGYDLADFDIDVNQESKLIYIKLGEQIVDNNLPEESVETIEKNNVINPIRSDEITNRLVEIKADEYETAIDKGIEKMAEDNAKEVILNALAKFEGYRVQFE